MKREILIVEDDADLREILTFNLENAGYSVLAASSAEEALGLLSSSTALILLDVMLPGLSGFQLARRIRLEGKRTPIIFLTARSEENDILTGFSAGGDDYIPKPFSINEVLARIKAVLKRSGESPANVLRCGTLAIDFDAKTASDCGRELPLSRKEFQLLSLLAQHPDTCFSRAALIRELWKEAPYVLERTVDVHIARIRAKLGEHKDLIRNRIGFGYYFDSHEAERS